MDEPLARDARIKMARGLYRFPPSKSNTDSNFSLGNSIGIRDAIAPRERLCAKVGM